MPITPLYVTTDGSATLSISGATTVSNFADLISESAVTPLNITGSLTVTPPTFQPVTVFAQSAFIYDTFSTWYAQSATTAGLPLQVDQLNIGTTATQAAAPLFPQPTVLTLWDDTNKTWRAAACDVNGHLLVSNNP